MMYDTFKNDNIRRSREFQEIIDKRPTWIFNSGIGLVLVFLITFLLANTLAVFPNRVHVALNWVEKSVIVPAKQSDKVIAGNAYKVVLQNASTRHEFIAIIDARNMSGKEGTIAFSFTATSPTSHLKAESGKAYLILMDQTFLAYIRGEEAFF
jgi:hypothetical protein